LLSTTVSSLSVGYLYACVVMADGSVRCWGENGGGQLGDGTTTDRPTPIAVSEITTATQVSAGDQHTCATLSSGSVMCWGYNPSGQLGIPNDPPWTRPTPVLVPGITTATQVATGRNHTCALLADQTVRCWGEGTSGQLGNGATTSSATPVEVSGLTTATHIVAAELHTCALLSSGSVVCWGYNGDGQLGDGTTTERSSPVSVVGLTTATQVTANRHVCARLADSTAYCWGANNWPQLGDRGYGQPYSSLPIRVTGIAAVIDQISAGGGHTCTRLSDATVSCWGFNNLGQLGTGDLINRRSPTPVSGLTNVLAVGTGVYHSCALLAGTTVACWGAGSSGQLGYGGTSSSLVPIFVALDTNPVAGQPPEQTFGVVSSPVGSIGMTTSATAADPVNTFTGAFVHAETDLALAGTGVPFELTRSYTSADTASGRFGQGWTDTYQASVTIEADGDAVVKGDEGQRLTFDSQGGGVFVDPPGARASLASIPGGYRLTTSDQLVYEFDSTGRLLSKRNRNAQGVTLTYDGGGRLQTVSTQSGDTATFAHNAENLVSAVSLSDGRSVSYGYTSGRLTSFTDARGKQWTYTYDAGGRLATIVDPLGHAQVSNVYDQTSGRVTQQTDAVNKTTTFAWDSATQTATVTDPNGHVWKDVYVDGVLSKRIDGTNRTTEFGFDADFNGTSVKSPAGETATMTFDAAGNMLTAVAPASLGSATKTFVYNGRNDPTSVTDARGKIATYTYTAAGNLETATQDGLQRASYTYDTAGRVQTASDANGRTTAYTYDADGNVASVTQPDPDGPGPLGQPKTTFTYDSQGNVLFRVDPKGNVSGCGCAGQYTTSFTYNPAGQLLTRTDQLGHVASNVYDDAGRLTSSTDFDGRTTSFTYDNANRLLTETQPDPDGGGPLAAPVTTYAYDSAGNVATKTNPRGNTTGFGYDSANRLASVTGPDPDGGGPLTAPVTSYTYDANGNLASTVEPRGNLSGANPSDYRTSYTHDAAGRLRTTTTALGHLTTNAYDAVGNLQSVTDANGHVTAYTHDYAGRVLTVTSPDPDGGGPASPSVTTYSYDPAGNELTHADPNGRTTTRAYDALNRVVSITGPDPDGSGSQTSSVTSLAYDVNGNLLSQVAPNGNGTAAAGDGTTSYGYDRANRLTSIDYSDTTPDVSFTLDNVGNRLSMVDASGTETRSYDNLDRLLTVTRAGSSFSYQYDPAGSVTRRTYPDATAVDLTYDPLDRLTTVASGGRTTSYGYDAASNPVATTLPSANGFVQTRTYDRSGRLTGIKNQKGATVLADIVYTRDPVGNPLTETRTGASPVSKTFQYDAMDRLTGVCYQAGTCPGGDDPFIRWTYDPAGNRLTEQRPAGTTAYSYDGMDRLLLAGNTSYTYDRNGNQLLAGSRTLTWDLANRLRTTAASGTTTTYSYDGEGKRLQASTGSASNSKTNYSWDLSTGLPELVLERRGNNSLWRRYVNGLGPIFMSTGTNALYYHTDLLGSVTNVTNASGATQLTYDYEPFGTVRSQTGTLTNLVKFAGQYQDPTGLYHLRARQYDPASGRFLSVDPARQTVTGSAISAYAYAGNRPTVMIDPSGATYYSTTVVQGYTTIATTTIAAPADSNDGGLWGLANTVASIAYTLTVKDIVDCGNNPTVAACGVAVVGVIPAGRALRLVRIADDAALVARGGAAGALSPEGLAARVGTHPSGVTGWSAESKAGACLVELCRYIPNNQVGVTTVGDIRAVGGDVIATSGRSPNHHTISGISPDDLSRVFGAPVPNPVPPGSRVR